MQSCLGVTVMMHVLPIAFQLVPPSSFQCRPLSLRPAFTICFGLSILCPHLSLLIFLCLCIPPALSVLVLPRPLFPPCLPFPLWCCPLTSQPVPPNVPPADAPPPPPVQDPKSSCSSLDCSPFKFSLGVGGLITVASKLHTKSQRDCYCEAYNGIQAVMAISNRGVRPVSCV